ncbi:MAG: hypothetical protein Q4G61_03790 [Tissierellia bacterium]|nr:hypothetical protein [Tissierellia bacterium]
MKALFRVSILCMLLFLLTGCELLDQSMNIVTDNEDLKRPVLENIPIEGTWELIEITPLLEVNADILSKYQLGEQFYISPEFVKIHDNISWHPSFKSRYVNRLDFVKSKVNISDEDASTITGEGTVYTITDGQIFRQDIMKITEDQIGFIFDNILFSLQKTEDTVAEEVIDQYLSTRGTGENSIEEVVKSTEDVAVILGIRSSRKDTNGNAFNIYKTIFVREPQDNQPVVFSIRNLLLPRNNGFWMVGTEHLLEEDFTRDVFFAYPIAGGTRENSRYTIGSKNNYSILFLGKNHVSIEQYDYLSSEKSFAIYDLDKLIDGTKMTIADIAGEAGIEVYQNDTLKIIGTTPSEESLQDLFDTTNLGVRRTNGRWVFRSNISIVDRSNLIQREYTLDMLPIIDILPAESLTIPWDDIKTKVPSAIDAYMSPSGDILIVQAGTELLFYSVRGGIIQNSAPLSIQIAETDRIVMAEWTTGNQAMTWQEMVMKLDRIPVETTR